MADKLNKSRIKEVRKILGQTNDNLGKVRTTKEKLLQDVKRVYNDIRGSVVTDRLRQISVDELSQEKNGIRVALLKSAGFTNVAQLVGMNKSKLIAINGIGLDSAEKIMRIVNALQNETAKHCHVRLDPRNRTKETSVLVLSVCALLMADSVFCEAEQLEKNYGEFIGQSVSLTEPMTSSVRWLFMSGERKEKLTAVYMRMEDAVMSGVPEQASGLWERLRSFLRDVTVEQGWRYFEQNAASFYAYLEQNLDLAKGELEETENNGMPSELVASIRAFPVDTSLLNATLRSYQMFGTQYILHQKRVLLGDEMGLGKTMQAIAAMAHLAAQGKTHFMVVCPVSVKINWIREVRKHSKLSADEIHGFDREEEYERWVKEGGVAVTTYETLSRLTLSDMQAIDMLVVDEAHYVKNPEAQRTRALMKFMANADSVLFMTGTPLENKVDEMVFLVNCLNPTVGREISAMKSLAKAPEFRTCVAPVYLRRVREDVLTELPQKVEKQQWCPMNEAEKARYVCDLQEENGLMQIRQVSWNLDDLSQSTKAARLMEICEEAKEDNRKVLIFSYFLSTIRKLENLLADRCFGPITGDVPADRRQEIVDEFSAASQGSVLLAQIVAGGVGLNIQTASVVILCEPQLKPSIENQAISRVYRMGQAQNVMVHRLLTEGSIDERITEILKKKSEEFAHFADESEIDEINKLWEDGSLLQSIIEEERQKYGVTVKN